MPPRTLLMVVATVALGASCDRTPPTSTLPSATPPSATPPTSAPPTSAPDAAPLAATTPATAPEFDPGNGSNAFARQKPVMNPRAVGKATRRDSFATVGATADQVARFVDDLKKRLDTNDREALAAAMNYPLVVTVGEGTMAVGNGTQFLAHYDNIMTDPVVSAIRKANVKNVRVPTQGVTLGSDANHVENYVGVAIGDDRIWFDMVEVEGKPRLLVRMVNATRTK